MTESINQEKLLAELLEKSTRAGATAADAIVFDSSSVSVSYRLGKVEKIERSENKDLGLRVFVGSRQAIVSSTDFRKEAIKETISRAVAMARVAPEDPYCGIAEQSQLTREIPKIDIFGETEPSNENLIESLKITEEAARSVKGVTNSEGAEMGWTRANIGMAATNGFSQFYKTSSHSLSVSVLAGKGGDMERDYEFSTSVHYEDLDAPELIGGNAGKRAVRRLNAKKVKTQQVPVVFDPRVSGGLLRHYAGAINGSAISRGTSFLKNSLGKRIFQKGINIIDDPHRPRGHRSKPFDGEGLPNVRRSICEDGILNTWILDLASARQLGLQSTGHAARGTSAPPAPAVTNLYMEPGNSSRAQLISDISSGFYVTELIGMGINMITGDYSRGATGFWIEKGEIAYPVNEVTIAGNLEDMYAKLTPADDLSFRFGSDAPTVRIEEMTVAGT
tara:strand:- start:39 stop:1382 length:1344 start_codon:yes stop_codon:yes gene_type:complete